MSMQKITHEMILHGIQNGVIKITDEGTHFGNPEHGGCVICVIGDSWFYAFGLTGETTPLNEFLRAVPMEDIVQEIFDVLDGDGGFETELPDEYLYYYFLLKEAEDGRKSL